MADKTLARAIGRGIYGPSFDEAHAAPGPWSHLVAEQDQTVDRVIAALSADGMLVTPQGVWQRSLLRFIPGYRSAKLYAELETAFAEQDLIALGADRGKVLRAAILLAKAGVTGDEDIEDMVRSWHSEKLRWWRLAQQATDYAEGRG